MTHVSIAGREILLDGKPTYPDREFDDHHVQGLLFNVRAVQAIFDDANPDTRKNWTYPDTGTWDPESGSGLEEWCFLGVLRSGIWRRRRVSRRSLCGLPVTTPGK